MSDGDDGVLPGAGWYADPWRVGPVRWWDGSSWTGYTAALRTNRFAEWLPSWPRSPGDWLALVVAALSGGAIWIWAMWSHPRYSYGPHEDTGSSWFWLLMIGAAVLLGALFPRRWQLIAVGLAVPQLALAPWTTPRGDNDGLWILVLPLLVVFAVILYVVAGLSGSAVTAALRRNARKH